MGDVKKKKSGGGQNKSYYYSLTYDEDDTGSLDYAPADDELQKRVANILAETEIDVHHQVPALDDGRLDVNDNLFGDADDNEGSRRNSRSLDFELSDDGGAGEGENEEGEEGEEFQSVDSKSDTFRPDQETASVDDDFVRITRPYGSDEAARRQPQPGHIDAHGAGSAADDDVFVSGAMTSTSSASERSPKAATSGPVRHTGSSPLSVVYVKQKPPSTELYDGNFIDDDILEPQDERALDDNISQDLLPMPIEEMTLEMDEDEDDDDGIPDASSGVDADPIIFRKSAQRWYVRHRKLVIGAALVGSLLAAGGLAAVIYFAVAAFS